MVVEDRLCCSEPSKRPDVVGLAALAPRLPERGSWEALMTHHPVIAIDIEPLLVEALAIRTGVAGLHHVQVRLQDVTRLGLGITSGSADVILLFNLLHCEEPVALLRAAHEALRPGGRVGIIHWRSDVPTPRGPALSIRPKPQTCVDWLVQAGLSVERPPVVLPPYHFGLVGIKS